MKNLLKKQLDKESQAFAKGGGIFLGIAILISILYFVLPESAFEIVSLIFGIAFQIFILFFTWRCARNPESNKVIKVMAYFICLVFALILMSLVAVLVSEAFL